MHRLLGHVRSNVVAYLALFVALGGTAIAAAPIITSSDQVADDVILSEPWRSPGDVFNPSSQDGNL